MTSTISPAGAKQPRPGVRVPGDPGFWVVILGEMVIFSMLFGTVSFFHLRHPRMFAEGQAALSRGLGLANTVVLILGSVLVAKAQRAIRHGRWEVAGRLVAGAATCGIAFILIKAVDYAHAMSAGHWIDSNDFWMSYFVVTGAHLMHVIVGVIVLGVMLRSLRDVGTDMSPRVGQLLESGGLYWHMVDLIWLILFPLFYLVN